MIVALVVVFAWQQGGDSDGGGPLNAIAAAAERTQSEPGGRTSVRTVISSPARSESFTISGSGAFDAEGRSRAILRFRRPESGELVEMQVVGSEDAIYMSSDLFGSLPGGNKWMGLDLSSLPGSEAPVPTDGDAMGELALIEVWIDADGLVRRMRYVKVEREKGDEKTTTTDMRVDFFDFGVEPEIELPDSSEVFDATAIAKEATGLPSDE